MNRNAARRIVSFDWAVKTILRDKANAGVLEGFLSALLKQDIKVIDLLESESNRPDDETKYNRVDLLAKTENDERIIVEVQYESEFGYLKRLAYGASKAIVENLKIGEPYEKLKKVYSVSLLYFDVGDGDDYVYHGRTDFKGLHDRKPLRPKDRIVGDRGLRVNDNNVFPEYFLIPLKAFGGEVKDALDQWVYSFKNNEVLEEFDAPRIEELKKKFDYLAMSPEQRRDYEDYMMKLASLEGQMKNAFEEGREEGEKTKAVQTAFAMIAEGFSAAQTARLTGLSEREVEKIKRGKKPEAAL